jgi:tetratricopeptide (TPR) repeat protein
MKKSGKFVIAALLSFFMFGAAYAQDLSQTTEMYNTAATALNDGKTAEALTGFQNALKAATALGEEGATLVNDCKTIIPKIMFQIGKDAAAAQDFTTAIEKLASAYSVAKEYGKQETINDAKELLSQVYMAQGSTALGAKDYPSAIADYNKAIELDATNGKAYFYMGVAKDQSGDEPGAIAAYTKASENGEKENSLNQLANIFLIKANDALRAKNFASAIENGLKSSSYAENPQADKLVGIAAFNAKKYDQAITSIEKVVSADAKAPDMRYYLARAYEAKGNKAKACSNYKLAQNAPNAQIAAFCKSKVATLCK